MHMVQNILYCLLEGRGGAARCLNSQKAQTLDLPQSTPNFKARDRLQLPCESQKRP